MRYWLDFDDRFKVDVIQHQQERINQKIADRSCEFDTLFIGFGINHGEWLRDKEALKIISDLE